MRFGIKRGHLISVMYASNAVGEDGKVGMNETKIKLKSKKRNVLKLRLTRPYLFQSFFTEYAPIFRRHRL